MRCWFTQSGGSERYWPIPTIRPVSLGLSFHGAAQFNQLHGEVVTRPIGRNSAILQDAGMTGYGPRVNSNRLGRCLRRCLERCDRAIDQSGQFQFGPTNRPHIFRSHTHRDAGWRRKECRDPALREVREDDNLKILSIVSGKRPLALDGRSGTTGWRTVGRRIVVAAGRASTPTSTSCQAQQHKHHRPLHACPPFKPRGRRQLVSTSRRMLDTRKASTASLANLRTPRLGQWRGPEVSLNFQLKA